MATTAADLVTLAETLDTWGQAMDGTGDAPWYRFTCLEAEAMAGLMRALGNDSTAEHVISTHARGDDDPEDMHYPGDEARRDWCYQCTLYSGWTDDTCNVCGKVREPMPEPVPEPTPADDGGDEPPLFTDLAEPAPPAPEVTPEPEAKVTLTPVPDLPVERVYYHPVIRIPVTDLKLGDCILTPEGDAQPAITHLRHNTYTCRVRRADDTVEKIKYKDDEGNPAIVTVTREG